MFLPTLADGYGPSLDLNFLSGSLDPRISFSRGSLATQFDSSGKLIYCPHNLAKGSEAIGGANWNLLTGGTGVAPTVTQNYAASPAGTTTAARLQLNRGAGTTSTDSSYLQQGFGLSGINSNIKSIYLKSNDGLSHKIAVWDLNPGGTAPAIITVTPTWQRFSYAGQNFSGNCFIILGLRGDQATDQTADILAWGAQFELNLSGSSTPSAYLPTTDASASYGPRFDYDPVTHALTGLLIEEQRTNLLLQSNNLGTTWGNFSSATAAQNVTSPDGTVDAWTITDTAASAVHQYNNTFTVSSGATAAVSAFFKQGTMRYAQIAVVATSDYVYAVADLQSGTVTEIKASAGGTYLASSIIAAGNGWYRLAVTGSFAGQTTYAIRLILSNTPTPGGLASYLGTGSGTILFYGAQAEQAGYATSYIPTTTATATRSADVTTVATSAFAFNANAGTLHAKSFSANGVSAGKTGVAINDGTTSNFVEVYQAIDSNQAGFVVSVGGVSTALRTSSLPASGNLTLSLVGAWQSGDAAMAYNGNAASTAAPGSAPSSLTTLAIGVDGAGTTKGQIWWQRIRYWLRRLPNATLQSLTS